MDLARIQAELARAGIDGWLFYDFHNRDAIAYHVLGLDHGKFTSRRWFYWVPARGEPVRLVHRVEPRKLDSLPGSKRLYLGWRELHLALAETLGQARSVAMQISPLAAIPYVSTVDAGTADLVRSLGYDLVSSADLVQTFEAVIDEAGYRSHVRAGEKIQAIKDGAFQRIGQELGAGRTLTEFELQQWILERFEAEGLDCLGELPIVGVNDHPADPHFEPTRENARPFKRGDSVLIDLWAKLKEPGAIFYDITWCGFIGPGPAPRYAEIFRVARDARDAALEFVRGRFARGEPCHGYEVDDACRRVVEQGGHGPSFIHRTGHSIGQVVHGNGVNIDNLETKDERRLVPGICFSIEPGIYLPGEMAVRTEIDVFITPAGEVTVAGAIQRELVAIEA
ncbi:MAG TPA: M24 family metallopeptidase [Myxococcota bacterium]|nr:M24 family metallopeptidase [Myxococcota bacterium]HRY92466.1 M24 family metallopeptidase [Myxococcota bacterium]HSA24485.1 M24 family metallopeptidase [Myxococcota bacterium]